MKRLIAAEMLKLRLTPTTWWVIGLSILLPTIIMLVLPVKDVQNGKDVASLLSWAGISGYLTLMLGAIGATTEYRHRTIVPTLLVTPSRMKVAISQLVAYVMASLCVAILSILIVTIITVVRTGLHDISPGLMVASYLGSAAYIALSTLLGIGIGTLAKNQTATVAAIFIWFAGVDVAISTVFPDLGQYSLVSLGISLGGGSAGEEGPYQQLLSPIAAGFVYLTYAAIPLLIGLVRFRKADIA